MIPSENITSSTIIKPMNKGEEASSSIQNLITKIRNSHSTPLVKKRLRAFSGPINQLSQNKIDICKGIRSVNIETIKKQANFDKLITIITSVSKKDNNAMFKELTEFLNKNRIILDESTRDYVLNKIKKDLKIDSKPIENITIKSNTDKTSTNTHSINNKSLNILSETLKYKINQSHIIPIKKLFDSLSIDLKDIRPDNIKNLEEIVKIIPDDVKNTDNIERLTTVLSYIHEGNIIDLEEEFEEFLIENRIATRSKCEEILNRIKEINNTRYTHIRDLLEPFSKSIKQLNSSAIEKFINISNVEIKSLKKQNNFMKLISIVSSVPEENSHALISNLTELLNKYRIGDEKSRNIIIKEIQKPYIPDVNTTDNEVL